MHAGPGETLPAVELGLGAKAADRDRPTFCAFGSLLELLDPDGQFLWRFEVLREPFVPELDYTLENARAAATYQQWWPLRSKRLRPGPHQVEIHVVPVELGFLLAPNGADRAQVLRGNR